MIVMMLMTIMAMIVMAVMGMAIMTLAMEKIRTDHFKTQLPGEVVPHPPPQKGNILTPIIKNL